jgi:hypothetical protein
MIELDGLGIAFGGLYRGTLNTETGVLVHSASLITLPSGPEWQHIHPKSNPLRLDHTDRPLVGKWLDPQFQAVDEFAPLLQPRIWCPQLVTPIGKVSRWNPVGPSFKIPA